MGLDLPDIRFIIHLCWSLSLIEYAQESALGLYDRSDESDDDPIDPSAPYRELEDLLGLDPEAEIAVQSFESRDWDGFCSDVKKEFENSDIDRGLCP